jgi:hypothetical protein
MKLTKEKEEAVKKARVDLEVKERKLEEDKALLKEGRSESVTSSLTEASSSMKDSGAQVSSRRNATCPTKRTAAELAPDSCKKAKHKSKKAKMAESGPHGHSIYLGNMSSSISDITDSNRGSSDSGGEKPCGVSREKRHRQDVDESSSETSSESSISTTAAVIRGTGSEQRDHSHADVVMEKKIHSRPRKRSRQERSSLNPKFDLDYEEVFHTSNIPQLIATPAGRIIACKFANRFYIDCTGMSQ